MYELKADSTRDVSMKACRLAQAVIGQIRRMRPQSNKSVIEFAIHVWEAIATRDYVLELSARTIQDATPTDVIARLRRDALTYVHDSSQMERGAGVTVSAVSQVLGQAIDATLRHA